MKKIVSISEIEREREKVGPRERGREREGARERAKERKRDEVNW